MVSVSLPSRQGRSHLHLEELKWKRLTMAWALPADTAVTLWTQRNGKTCLASLKAFLQMLIVITTTAHLNQS